MNNIVITIQVLEFQVSHTGVGVVLPPVLDGGGLAAMATG
jgi:uncharacterized membrane protein